MHCLRIGPNLKQALLDSKSAFWGKAANYDVAPMAFQAVSGEYIGCNHAFEDMTGAPTAQILISKPADLFEPDVAKLLDRIRRQASAKLSPTSCVFWITFHHGAYQFVECRCFPVLDEHGLVGLATSFISGNELFLAEESLKNTRQILRHDLHAPLAGMLACMQNLPATADAAEARLRQRISSLFANCIKQLDLWMKCDAGKILNEPFQVQRINLAKMIKRVVEKKLSQCGYPDTVNIRIPPGVHLFWSSRGLAALLDSLLSLVCQRRWLEAAGNEPRSISFEALPDIQELRLTCPFIPAQQEEFDLQLYNRQEVLLALANGAAVDHVEVERQLLIQVGLPYVQATADDRIAALPLEDVLDYQDADFGVPRSFYCALFDMLKQSLAIFTGDRVVQTASRAFAALFCCSRDELIGRPYSAFASPYMTRVLDGLFALGEQQPERKGIIARKQLVLCVEGEIRQLEIHFSNLAEGGHAVSIDCTQENLQSQLFLQTMLDTGGRHLQSILKKTQGVLAELHDLRMLPEHIRSEVRLFFEETSHVLGVLEHWQNLEKIERGNYPLAMRPVDILKMIRVVLSRFRLQDAPIRIAEDNIPGDPAAFVVLGDESLLYMLFSNLVGNAKRAAQGGLLEFNLQRIGTTLHIALRNVGETPGYIRGAIFEKFIKGPDSSGMGLGTYSEKLIAILHRGQIALDASEPGFTTFRLELPCAP